MTCPETYTPKEIAQIAKKGGVPLKQMIKQVIKNLYDCPDFIKSMHFFVKSRGGNDEDAEDLIQEGLTQLGINLLKNKYHGDSAITSYAYGICKFKWFNKMRLKGLKTTAITEETKEHAGTQDVEKWVISEEAKKILWTMVQAQTGHCPEYLKMWALGYSGKEMAAAMNVTEKRVRKNTSNCRQRLRNWLAKHPQLEKMIQHTTILSSL